MTTYVALLRGINVGGNNMIPMVKLKQTFERLGFADVRTFIASGNVIFRTGANPDRLVKKIEAAIHDDFGLSIRVLLRDINSMARLVKAIPLSWVNDEKTKCDTFFLWKEADRKSVLKALPINPAIEDVTYLPGAVVWRIDRRLYGMSRIVKIVGTKLHQQMTVRNSNTVRKLYELMLATDKQPLTLR